MDADELMQLDRPLTDEETEFMEQHVLQLAQELQAHVEEITKDMDPNDPIVVNLRAKQASVLRNIEQAIECGEEQKGARDYAARHRPDPEEKPYGWELLPVYAWVNEFARVVGRLLASMHKRYYIHIHNLAGQAMLLSNCVALGHREPSPGEVIPVEELRAYRRIGHFGACKTLELLEDLSKTTGYCAPDVAHGKRLMRQIRDQFECDVAELDSDVRMPPRLREIQA